MSQHRRPQLAALAACVMGIVVFVVPSESGDVPRPHSCLDAPAPANGSAVLAHDHESGGGSGMRAYVDPDTGELRTDPPPDEARRRARDEGATSMSQTGLFEQTAPGGGVMVDLQGRFQNEMRATITPDGVLHTDCIDLPVVGPPSH